MMFNREVRVNGLVWDEFGGALLPITAASTPGTGRIITKGPMGNTMVASLQIALTLARNTATLTHPTDPTLPGRIDITLSVPDDEMVMFDGASAGVAMYIALVAIMTERTPKWDMAATGELLPDGSVVAVQNTADKLAMAHSKGVTTVLLPSSNIQNLMRIPLPIWNDVQILPVRGIDNVIRSAYRYT